MRFLLRNPKTKIEAIETNSGISHILYIFKSKPNSSISTLNSLWTSLNFFLILIIWSLNICNVSACSFDKIGDPSFTSKEADLCKSLSFCSVLCNSFCNFCSVSLYLVSAFLLNSSTSSNGLEETPLLLKEINSP